MVIIYTTPKRKGKQYNTPEECLKENKEHIWGESFIDCFDESCSRHVFKKICYHCPAEQMKLINHSKNGTTNKTRI